MKKIKRVRQALGELIVLGWLMAQIPKALEFITSQGRGQIPLRFLLVTVAYLVVWFTIGTLVEQRA